MKLQVKQAKFEDWFPIRDEKDHRYFANDCIHENWRATFQLINAVLLAREGLAFVVKSYVEGVQEYDWAQLIVDSVSQEVSFLKIHMLLNAEVEALKADLETAQNTVENLRSQLRAKDAQISRLQKSLQDSRKVTESRKPLLESGDNLKPKLLILALDGLLYHVAGTEAQMHSAKANNWPIIVRDNSWAIPRTRLNQFLDTISKMFIVLIWSTDTTKNMMSTMRALANGKFLPQMVIGKDCYVWAQEECEKEYIRQDGSYTLFQDFWTLHDYNLCTRDILIIDNCAEHNMTNHPNSALHPLSFNLLQNSADEVNFLLSDLLGWLQSWAQSVDVTTDSVQQNRNLLPGHNPVSYLVNYLTPLTNKASLTLLENVPYRQRSELFVEDKAKLLQQVQATTSRRTNREAGTSQPPPTNGPPAQEESEDEQIQRVNKRRVRGRENPKTTRGRVTKVVYRRPNVIKDNMPTVS
ncbi:hypothetical protein R1sor_009887 [Riccia sorocarpa]|uniref:Mitochondrial import inner membrane translocase subunit TIM50 n=1 Tax=Riccia sorocarpa TaxID=122646 RepID=A0ABD3HY44_9MARC